MKKLLVLIFAFVALCSCTDTAISTPADERLYFGDVPNSETRYITKKTAAIADDDTLLKDLEQKLKKDHFVVTKNVDAVKNKTSFNNCKNNTILVLEGNGILNYYARRSISEKAMKHTYADFSLTIFTFPNEKIATENYIAIDEALYSGGYCNGKSPTALIQKKNKIYYFFTRAAMFETYTVRYANFIKNFKS